MTTWLVDKSPEQLCTIGGVRLKIFGQLLVNFWSTFGQLLVNNQASHIILRSHSRPHLCRQSFGIPVVFTKTSGTCPTVRSVTRLIDYLHQVLSVKALLARLREALLWCAAKD